MSHVSSIILQVSCAEIGFEEPENTHIEKINQWLDENGKLPLVSLTDYMTIGKHPQTLVFGGGYNYFPEEEFAHFVTHQIVYEYPECVVLVINPEDGATKIFRPIFNQNQ